MTDDIKKEAIPRITKEEAEAEENKLIQMAEMYFKSNPLNTMSMTAEEEEDLDEDITVSLNQEGDILSETIEKKTEVKEEILVPQTSFVEQAIVRQVILGHKQRVAKSYREIASTEKSWYDLSEGSQLFDELSKKYRKENQYLSDLLMQETINIEDIDNEKIKGQIKKDIEEFVRQMLQFSQKFDTYIETLEVLSDD